jgi:hypothetical protein
MRLGPLECPQWNIGCPEKVKSVFQAAEICVQVELIIRCETLHATRLWCSRSKPSAEAHKAIQSGVGPMREHPRHESTTGPLRLSIIVAVCSHWSYAHVLLSGSTAKSSKRA